MLIHLKFSRHWRWNFVWIETLETARSCTRRSLPKFEVNRHMDWIVVKFSGFLKYLMKACHHEPEADYISVARYTNVTSFLSLIVSCWYNNKWTLHRLSPKYLHLVYGEKNTIHWLFHLCSTPHNYQRRWLDNQKYVTLPLKYRLIDATNICNHILENLALGWGIDPHDVYVGILACMA